MEVATGMSPQAFFEKALWSLDSKFTVLPLSWHFWEPQNRNLVEQTSLDEEWQATDSRPADSKMEVSINLNKDLLYLAAFQCYII